MALFSVPCREPAPGGAKIRAMSGADTIRAGVVGAGVFGGHHARTLARAGGVELVGVCDTDLDRAQAVASACGAPAAEGFDDFGCLLDAVDAVVVATPAPSHAALAAEALLLGVHTLVEKPLATTLREADRLVGLAEVEGRVLQVGHQESYAARALGLPGRGVPDLLRATRHGRRCGRGTEVSVVMDLMIHDLHLAVLLTGTDPDAAEAEVLACEVRAGGGERPDRVEATLRLGATRCELSASRVEERPVRTLELSYPRERLRVDLATREVVGAGGRVRPLASAPGNPLACGAAAFLRAIRGEGPPGVCGREGRAALRLALQVERAAREAA